MKNYLKIIIISQLFFLTFSLKLSAKKILTDSVIVDKSDGKLYLLSSGKIVKSFHVVFGQNPKGAKQKEGDGKTPEGNYTLDYKNSYSKFYKSILISYPNKKDLEIAKRLGVNPGGNIMIHGQKNGWSWAEFVLQHLNWTRGCIALSNENMDKLCQLIKAGTPIKIRP